jgi:hypothetical protein
VFPTGSTSACRPEPDPAPVDARSDGPRSARRTASDQRGEHHEFHARPGHRPGGTPTASARSGGDTDIVRPLPVDPARASRIVLDGIVFETPLPHLRLQPAAAGDDRLLVWAVLVVAERERPVPATLHLLGSPSMVVTVLELVPHRRLRWGRDRFVRHGVAAMDALAERIVRAAA